MAEAGTAAPFLIPGTETAIPGISAGAADFGVGGPATFFIPGTDTPLPASAGAFNAGTATFGPGGTAGVAPGATAGTLPAATQLVGASLPSDFTGGTVGTGNAFGLPGGSVVEGPVNLGAPAEAGAGAAAAAPSSQDAGISQLLSSDADVFNEETPGFFEKATQALNNPLARAGIAGGGLLASGLLNKGTPVGSAPISAAAGASTANAAALRGQSNQNLGALNTGALPAGAASAIKQSTDAAKASVRSKFAGMGLSGSSMEGQELASVDQQAGAMRLAQAEQLTTLGLKEAQLASGEGALATEDYLALMNARLRQDDRLANALARFSGAMAGGTVSQA